jgi:hypothetical protein
VRGGCLSRGEACCVACTLWCMCVRVSGGRDGCGPTSGRACCGGTVWVDLGIIPYFYLDSISLTHAFTYTLGRLAFCEH